MGILGSPYCGIGASICIGQEMLFLSYAGLFLMEVIIIIYAILGTWEVHFQEMFVYIREREVCVHKRGVCTQEVLAPFRSLLTYGKNVSGSGREVWTIKSLYL